MIVLQAGDTGTFIEYNSGSPPFKFSWATRGGTYFVHGKDFKLAKCNGQFLKTVYIFDGA